MKQNGRYATAMKILLWPLLLSAAACSATTRQKLPALNFDYKAALLTLADEGHTERVRFANGGPPVAQKPVGTTVGAGPPIVCSIALPVWAVTDKTAPSAGIEVTVTPEMTGAGIVSSGVTLPAD